MGREGESSLVSELASLTVPTPEAREPLGVSDKADTTRYMYLQASPSAWCPFAKKSWIYQSMVVRDQVPFGQHVVDLYQ